MKSPEKICSYVGFAARARKIVFGADNVLKKRKLPVIIISGAADNTLKKVTEFAEKTKSPIVTLDEGALDGILKRNNCKVIAVTDENLAKAIIENA